MAIERKRIAFPAPAVIEPEAKAKFVYKPRAQPAAFNASPMQQAFFDWVLDGSGHALLEAVAGAGKTTTLVQALGKMEGSIFFGAYNKKIADEIKRKAEEAQVLRPGLYINTMHGSGFSDWRRGHKEVKVEDRKVLRLIDAMGGEYKEAETFIRRMVSFGKQFLIGVRGKTSMTNLDAWVRLVNHFGVEQDLPGSDTEYEMPIQQALALTVDIYKQSIDQCADIIDFDDMIFAPIYHNTRIFQNDWVLLDECQDVNPARREMAKRLLSSKGRFVAVGDSRQAIYGFTGAGGDSVEKIIAEFGCTRLPLTVTYRCPKAVVEFVHQWVSHIEAHENAPDGMVRAPLQVQLAEGESRKEWFIEDAPSVNDAILCRYTKPLVKTAFSMIRQGIACKVEGRDIGKGLIDLASTWKLTSLDAFEKRLDLWLQRQLTKAGKEGSERKAQDAQDKVDTLKVFIERCRSQQMHTIKELIGEIERIFADNVTGCVTLSTIHKAKGREWPRVYWLQAAIRQRNLKDWEVIQETNMNYVAGTRAQSELILVPEMG